MQSSTDDDRFMHRALELAERGRGFVEPNPLVGAVVVRNGEIVGEGWHERFGEAHAEVQALREADQRSRGATLYVTLEPCCHQGKTPPCTAVVINSGISRVVAAIEDPFALVAGKGFALLRDAGVEVDIGVGAEEARRRNAPYLKLNTKQIPYVHAKWAMTLDGKIASRTGDARWISNERSRAVVHQLRGRMDAIVVGIGTALADDPLLTARPGGPRVACRVVLDSAARLPIESHLVRTARETPLLIVSAADAPAERVQALREAGCDWQAVGRLPTGALDIMELLHIFGTKRWTNLLVEGGAAVLGSFFDARTVDEVHCFIAPKIIGGQGAPAALAGEGLAKMAQAWSLDRPETRLLGEDIYVHGHVRSDRAAT